jgi:uncharacterized membrane protein YgcG
MFQDIENESLSVNLEYYESNKHKYTTDIQLLYQNKVEFTIMTKAKLIAIALHKHDHEFAKFLLKEAKMVEVLKACEILDSRRYTVQLHKKLACYTKNSNTSKQKLNKLNDELKQYQNLNDNVHMSLTQSKATIIINHWIKQLPKDQLEFYAIMYELSIWKKLINLLHTKTTDFQLDWFQKYVYGEKAPLNSFVSKSSSIDKDNVYDIIQEYKPVYNFLRSHKIIKELLINDNKLKGMIAEYTPLNVILWFYWEELHCPEVDKILVKRLDEEQVNLPYGKLVDRLMLFPTKIIYPDTDNLEPHYDSFANRGSMARGRGISHYTSRGGRGSSNSRGGHGFSYRGGRGSSNNRGGRGSSNGRGRGTMIRGRGGYWFQNSDNYDDDIYDQIHNMDYENLPIEELLSKDRELLFNKLLAIAEDKLKRYAIKLDDPTVVLCDASGSMEIAIKTSSIVTSILVAVCRSALHVFNSEDKVMEAPENVVEAIKFSNTCKAEGGTSPAASLYPYYSEKKEVKTFIIITDEQENEGYKGMSFASMFKEYLQMFPDTKLIFISFLEKEDKGFMCNQLKAVIPEYTPIQFRFDPSRPDLTKLDHILGSISKIDSDYNDGPVICI